MGTTVFVFLTFVTYATVASPSTSSRQSAAAPASVKFEDEDESALSSDGGMPFLILHVKGLKSKICSSSETVDLYHFTFF